MTKSDPRKPINFVGMYFIDEHGEDYRTGQIIAQISDGYYLAQFDCTHDNDPPPPLEVLSAADFNKVSPNQINRREAGRRAFITFRRNFGCSAPRTSATAG